MGFWAVPSTTVGSGIPAASRIVGPMSMACVKCFATRRSSLIRSGHESTMGLRVPPRWEAHCLPHWNGVFPAHAQADA